MEGDTDLNIGMVGGELHGRLQEYLEDDELWCAVVTGAGQRAFTAGGNIRRFAGDAPPGGGTGTAWHPQAHTIMTDLEMWKPVIAAVNGYCIGAGMMLA